MVGEVFKQRLMNRQQRLDRARKEIAIAQRRHVVAIAAQLQGDESLIIQDVNWGKTYLGGNTNYGSVTKNIGSTITKQ